MIFYCNICIIIVFAVRVNMSTNKAKLFEIVNELEKEIIQLNYKILLKQNEIELEKLKITKK